MTRVRIAIIVILAVLVVFFSLMPIRAMFWLHPGYNSLTTDSSLRVVDVDAGGPAERAGIRVGDRVEVPTSLEGRLYLQDLRLPRPGQSLTVRVLGENGSRAVNYKAPTTLPDTATIAYYFVGAILDLTFVVVASILVLMRPSKMTWAFFIYCIATCPGQFFNSYVFPAWFDFGSRVFSDALRSFGYGALLIFCARVPNDRVVGSWRYLEWVAAPLVVVSLLVCYALIDLSIIGAMHADRIADSVQLSIINATYVAGIFTLIATHWRERGVDRKRVGWIIAGFAAAFAAKGGADFSDIYGPLFVPDISSWQQFVPEVFQVAIPLTVAYAVVRHQALNVGFVANRTLVYGLFLCVGFTAFALLDVLATKRFAHNQFEIGLDVAVALAIGLSFQFFHPRAIRLIDRVFLPERYQAAIALDKLRTTLGLVRGDDRMPNRAVETVAKELMLSSLAIFKKVPDGGYVRYAAAGWPKGTAWHVFPGEPLSRSFAAGKRVVAIDGANAPEVHFPPEPDRPRLGIALSPQTPTERLILVGAHVNGRRPDRDEVRRIASLLGEFG